MTIEYIVVTKHFGTTKDHGILLNVPYRAAINTAIDIPHKKCSCENCRRFREYNKSYAGTGRILRPCRICDRESVPEDYDVNCLALGKGDPWKIVRQSECRHICWPKCICFTPKTKKGKLWESLSHLTAVRPTRSRVALRSSGR